jgi:hypothetical protein
MSIQAALVVTAGAALALCCRAPAARASGLSFTNKSSASGNSPDAATASGLRVAGLPTVSGEENLSTVPGPLPRLDAGKALT